WTVDEAAFTAYLEEARRQIGQVPALLSRVDFYNAQLAYLARALALGVALGETHRRSVNAALAQFHAAFFAAEESIVAGVRRAIQERFLASGMTTPLPEAWFYWPVTAGGLGLTQANIL